MTEEPMVCPRCEHGPPVLSSGATENSMRAHCLWCDFGVILNSNLPIPPERYVEVWNDYARRECDAPKIVIQFDDMKIKMQNKKMRGTTYYLMLPRGQISVLTEDEFRKMVSMIRKVPGEEYE